MQDLEGYFVHSNYDPLTEAKRSLEKVSLQSQVLFFFGIGLGYFLEALLETNLTNKIVYAWEPLGGSLEYEEVKKNLKLLKRVFF